ncbi:MAG: hypothetical protein FJ276_04370 [Planctomycetes bacterium]|nr:hypothetical protein [Planctomycetota bacterium]
MHRRDFVRASAIGLGSAAAVGNRLLAQDASSSLLRPEIDDGVPRPRDVKLAVKPVMTNIIHSDVWEGPCRWDSVTPAEEQRRAEEMFLRWPQQLRGGGLGNAEGLRVLEPVHLTFNESFRLRDEDFARLEPDIKECDAIYLFAGGGGLPGCQIAERYKKPVLLQHLGCRNVYVAAHLRSKGCEVHVAADDGELAELVSLLRARKVLRETRILFPSNTGLPPAASDSIWDLDDLQRRLGVRVQQIPYQELADQMETKLADESAVEEAAAAADELLRRAQRSFVDRKYVARSLQFYQTIRSLMKRHACNAFTIECFEFCSSRLPEKWGITPCLLHALFQDGDFASSCEADMSSLVTVRMLMSVARKSCHQGNGDPKDPTTFRINHSAPSLKMNGLDQPDLPFQLGRFTTKGFGTKVVIDFMNNQEKTVTVARINPQANRLLVLRGQLTGSSGWDQDLVGCSVEAVIRPPEGKLDEYLHRRVDYGNHLQWVYGDYTRQLKTLCEMLEIDIELFA